MGHPHHVRRPWCGLRPGRPFLVAFVPGGPFPVAGSGGVLGRAAHGPHHLGAVCGLGEAPPMGGRAVAALLGAAVGYLIYHLATGY
ncbi:hypothetical protein AV953_gp28 [Thermus virus IN93]|uniref:Uncharacterized protein n=1 Tax=Thermus virus IN93 TaxID=1714273 RepID=Q859R4_9VIRU|nr:hypothetical protein AV953_gp28 [Thermus virus IN93]BAC55307.1 hypothetical protein [Thermus virus IN93]